MIRNIDPEDIFSIRENIPLLDARSPSEYRTGHIPHALNLPLLDDKERVIIGTLYKQEGREKAMDKGLELLGPKAYSLVQSAKEIAVNNKLILYCWRGGMRSGSLAWLLDLYGFEVLLLRGGYKEYRTYLSSIYEEELNLMILGGYTGSGKTEILQELKANGEQVIDLEALAIHRGSAFGSIGMGEQPSNEQFNNHLHEAFMDLDLSKRIWLEDESLSIGRVYLPHELYKKMTEAPRVFINISSVARAHYLKEVYGNISVDMVKDVIDKIKKRMGGQNVKAAIEALETNDKQQVIELLLHYYDKSYSHSLEKKPSPPVLELNCEKVHAVNNAKKILEWIRK